MPTLPTCPTALFVLLATASGAAASPDPRMFHGALAGADDRAHEGRVDLDGDGRADCWSARYDGGSGFGGVDLEVRPGCGEAVVALGGFGSFGELLTVTTFAPTVPPALATALQAGLREGLFGAAARRCRVAREGCPAIDGSFAWLLAEAATRGAPGERRYHPVWTAGAPTLPPAQVVDLAGPEAAALVRTLDAGEPSAALLAAPRGFVAYFAHNHGLTLARSGGCARWDLWTTAHGVAVVDRASQRWSWAFVSTGGDKLRHPSIAAVACDDLRITIDRRGADGPERVVVDPVRGAWRALPRDP